MATVKSYTDLQQSKKLAEILPIESADMYYRDWKRMTKYIRIAHVGTGGKDDLPCWSLAALLAIINENFYIKLYHDGVAWNITVWHHDNRELKSDTYANTPIDACYETILKLHEQNLL